MARQAAGVGVVTGGEVVAGRVEVAGGSGSAWSGRPNMEETTTAMVSTMATAASTSSATTCSRGSVLDRRAAVRCRG